MGFPVFSSRYTLYHPSVTTGILTKIINSSNTLNSPLYYITNAEVYSGSSGGALINDSGQLIGIINSNYKFISKITVGGKLIKQEKTFVKIGKALAVDFFKIII